jgi:hypothetical protein
MMSSKYATAAAAAASVPCDVCAGIIVKRPAQSWEYSAAVCASVSLCRCFLASLCPRVPVSLCRCVAVSLCRCVAVSCVVLSRLDETSILGLLQSDVPLT